MTLLMNQTICFSAICMCFFSVIVVETTLFVCWCSVTGSLLNHWVQHSVELFNAKAHSLQILSPILPHLLSSILFCSLLGPPVPRLHVSLIFLLLPIILPNFFIIYVCLSPYNKLFYFVFRFFYVILSQIQSISRPNQNTWLGDRGTRVMWGPRGKEWRLKDLVGLGVGVRHGTRWV